MLNHDVWQVLPSNILISTEAIGAPEKDGYHEIVVWHTTAWYNNTDNYHHDRLAGGRTIWPMTPSPDLPDSPLMV